MKMPKIRWICQLFVGFVMLILPFSLSTRLVVAFLYSIIIGIVLQFVMIQKFTPWQLVQKTSCHPKRAFLEALIYVLSSYGLLAYLATSEHELFHFVFGFLGIVSAWLMVQLIYSEQYALRYYFDGKGMIFPECPRPHWTEFLYEGFCIACCYQTSDVVITTTAMRQLINTHALLSYGVSVSIIAILFGLVANLF